MGIKDFAYRHRLKLRKDECGDLVIAGRRGHIAEHGNDRLSVYISTERGYTSAPNPRRWNNARRRLEAAGCQIWNDGDAEGVMLFDPMDNKQARAVIREAGIKPRRVLSALQREHLERIRPTRPADNFSE